MATRKSLNIGINFDSKQEVINKLNTLLKDVQKDTNIKLNFDDSSLKNLSNTLNNITKQMQNAFNTSQYIKNQASQVDNVTMSYKKQAEVISKLENEKSKSSTYKLHSDGTQELIKDVTTLNAGLGRTETITQNVAGGLTTMTKKVDFSKLENTISSMQAKLNSSKNNGLIDESVITKLQSKLNSINTNTPEKEIKELQNTINNLGSSNNQIVRVQNAISKMESSLSGMKGKYGSLVGDSSSISQLQKYESELTKLKDILEQLKGGTGFGGAKISSELNQASESSRNLKTAVVNSANALNLAQKDATTFGGAMKTAFQNAGLYMSTYEAINMVFRAFKDGLNTVINMNTEMANLNKVVNMTKEQLASMSESAVKMGKDLGQSSIEVAKAQAEFGRMYKDSNTINELSKTAILGANVMDGTSTAEVAKGLTTIVSSMKLEANDSMTILDSMNEIQNNYRIGADDMLNALAEVGSTAYTSGADLQKVEGYITSIAVATGQSGDEIGNALRSMMARLYKIGAEGIEAEGKPEKMLKEMGVAVRDNSGQFRDFGSVLDDLSVKWQTMSDTEKIATAQQVAGVQRYNQFMSLMNNYKMAVDATTTAMNSQGSATKENDIYMQSAQAKIQVLKTTIEEFWLKAINSDSVIKAIEGLTSLVNAFSNLPTAIGLATTALLVFKGEAIMGAIVSIGSFVASLVSAIKFSGGLKLAMGELSIAFATNPLGLFAIAISTVVGGLVTLSNHAEKSKENLQKFNEEVGKSNTDIQKTVNSAEGYIKKIEDLNNAIANTNSIEKKKELTNQLTQAQKDLATALPNATNDVSDNGENLATSIEYTKEIIQLKKDEMKINAQKFFDENKGLLSDIDELDRKKAKLKEYQVALAQGKTSIKQNFDTVENGRTVSKAYDVKISSDDAKKLNDEITQTTKTASQARVMAKYLGDDVTESQEKIIEGVEDYSKSLEKNTQEKKKNNSGNPSSTANEQKINLVSNALNELKSTSDLSANSVNNLKNVLPNLDLSNMSAEQKTQALTQAQNELKNSLTVTGNSAEQTANKFKELANIFSSISGEVGTLEKALEEFQKNKTIDESTMSSILSTGDPQLISLLGDQNTFLERGNALLTTLKQKRDQARDSAIQEAQAVQNGVNSNAQAYNTDVANKTNAENSKSNVAMQLLNALAQATGQNVSVLAQQYGVDVNNKANSENSKGSVATQLLNALARATGQNVNTLAQQYGVDATNFANAQSSKLKSFNEFASAMSTASIGISSPEGAGIVSENGIVGPFESWKANQQLKDVQGAYNKYASDFQAKQQEALRSQYRPVGTSVGSSYSPVSAGYSPVSVGNVSGGGSGGSSGGGSGSGGSKASEKEVANLESLVDRYYRLKNVIDLVSSTIEGYETAMKNAYGNQYVDLVNKEIQAYKQKQQAIKNNIAEMDRERWSLRQKLSAGGFDFDANWNINSNYASRLQALTNQANRLSGDAKENAIKNVKDLSEATKRYADLTFNEIPKANKEWNDLSNSIQDAYKNMEKAVADQEKKTYDVIKYYAEKTTKTKQDEIDKQIDQINKLYNDEDKKEDLNNKQKQLADLKSEMDKFEFATDKLGISKFKQLQEQYKQLQEEMNKSIRDNQKEDTLDSMNKEKDALSSALEDYLKPENVNRIIEDGLKSGMINIMGQTVSLQQANAQMLKETEVGYVNVNSQIKEWKDNLSTIIAMMPQVSGIASALGYNIDKSIPKTVTTSGLDITNVINGATSGINISMPFSIGSVRNDNDITKIQSMINSAVSTMKTELNKKFNLR